MHDVACRGMWICVRSKDAQKQLARMSLNKLISGFQMVYCAQAVSLFADLGKSAVRLRG